MTPQSRTRQTLSDPQYRTVLQGLFGIGAAARRRRHST
ncbi:hypothetical protein ABIA33_002092 [Streptacidiphilus sp. MAP12-16]